MLGDRAGEGAPTLPGPAVDKFMSDLVGSSILLLRT